MSPLRRPCAIPCLCRYALRTAGRAAAPLLPLLLDRLPQHFKATRQCTLLYVGSELVKTFGDDPGNTDSVGMLFQVRRPPWQTFPASSDTPYGVAGASSAADLQFTVHPGKPRAPQVVGSQHTIKMYASLITKHAQVRSDLCRNRIHGHMMRTHVRVRARA